MEFLVEIIVWLFAELILTIVGEALAELGLNSLSNALGTRFWKRIFVGFIYAVGGFVLGALSLTFLPRMAFTSKSIPVLYFILSPIVAGLALCFVSWIINRGINETGFFQLPKFVYGVIFALTVASTRSVFG